MTCGWRSRCRGWTLYPDYQHGRVRMWVLFSMRHGEWCVCAPGSGPGSQTAGSSPQHGRGFTSELLRPQPMCGDDFVSPPGSLQVCLLAVCSASPLVRTCRPLRAHGLVAPPQRLPQTPVRPGPACLLFLNKISRCICDILPVRS